MALGNLRPPNEKLQEACPFEKVMMTILIPRNQPNGTSRNF